MASNVVAAVTALVGKGASATTYPATPAMLGNATGYHGSSASQLRKHMGRRWGLRAAMFGGTWPSYTHAQWQVLMGLAPGQVTAQGQVRALAVHKAAGKRTSKRTAPLVPLHKVAAAGKAGARGAKRTAKGKGKAVQPQVAPTTAPPASAPPVPAPPTPAAQG